MAMIECPECGRMVSSMASSCPNCGCPITKSDSTGIVQVKLGVYNSTQNATIISNGKTIWSGQTGQIVELNINRPTNIQVNYKMGMYDAAGSCEGIIDPGKSKKWQVVSRPGLIFMKLTLQPVDIFDAN